MINLFISIIFAVLILTKYTNAQSLPVYKILYINQKLWFNWH